MGNYKRQWSEYEILECIGEGLQGKVYLANDKKKKIRVALKIPKTSNKDEAFPSEHVDALVHEIRILTSLNHPHIVQLQGVLCKRTAEHTHVASVLEYAENGDLYDIIANTGPLSEDHIRIYFKQLMSALQACQDQGIAHRDIKLENLLLDKNYNLKLCDFGLAKSTTQRFRDREGTRSYMAPEVLDSFPYDGKPADLWSAGVALFVMGLGYPPLREATEDDWWFNNLLHGQYDRFWAGHGSHTTKSREFIDLISQLLSVNPVQRPTISEIMAHPWMLQKPEGVQDLKSHMRNRRMKSAAMA